MDERYEGDSASLHTGRKGLVVGRSRERRDERADVGRAEPAMAAGSFDERDQTAVRPDRDASSADLQQRRYLARTKEAGGEEPRAFTCIGERATKRFSAGLA